MLNQILLCLFFIIGFLLFLFIIELVFRKLKMTAENSRMVAHFITISSTISFPYLFNDHWYVLFLAILFTIILIASTKTKYLNSVNGIKRKTFGGQLLPIAIYVTFLIAFKGCLCRDDL